MLTSDLDFELPADLIAQQPVFPRHHARLMHLNCSGNSVTQTPTLSHKRVSALPDLLRAGDLLVFNNTRVLRARLRGHKVESGGAVEAILLREEAVNLWEVLLKPSARLKPGTPIRFQAPAGTVVWNATPERRTETGWLLRFLGPTDGDNSCANSMPDVRTALPQLGDVPLPPYIHQDSPEEEHYQTVFARQDVERQAALDSAAAPTAGLHFTTELLDALAKRGIETTFVTLGVGVGTFRPVKTETLEEHDMHEEEFEISADAAHRINEQRRSGRRVVAVGTTTTRVLESFMETDVEPGKVRAGFGRTSIFLRPCHRFRVIDALITNFHLPRSTLLALVAALAEDLSRRSGGQIDGLQAIRYAYNEAVAQRYRFFSFGDAMFIE